MKSVLTIFFIIFIVFAQSGCNSNRLSKKIVLQQCKILGDESILYARANYVKLFHIINPDKFSEPYQHIKDFDHITHRNVINTYDIAVRKLKAKDPISLTLLKSCKDLAKFSTNFVDQAYPRAITFKNNSKLGPLTDNFFLEINKIVKFDHSIGKYKKGFTSFKQRVKNYEVAIQHYLKKFKAEISEDE